MNVVVEHCGEKVVCRTYRVKISGKMQIYVLHRDYLSITAAGSAALYAENGAERRLSQSADGTFADSAESVRKTYRGSGFALACRGGRYCRHENELAVFAPVIFREFRRYFRLISPVGFYIFFVYSDRCRNFAYRAHFVALCDLYIR